MSDFDPVEIDINLKQNVDAEGEKAVEGIDNIVNSSDKARAELEKMISVKKEFIAGLREGITEASKEFANMNIAPDDKRAIEFKNIVAQMVDELNKEEAALSGLENKTESYAVKQKSFRAQILDTKESMRLLRLEGKENTEQYKELQTRLGLLGNVYQDITEEQKALASDTPQLQGAIEGLSTLAGLLSAGAGAFGLVNSESERFEKIQTKVQSLMAITIGLQQVANALESTSAFRIQTVTKAKLMWTAATVKLSTALGISNVAAKVLMGTLTLGLSVAIGVIINMLDNFVTKQREAKKAQDEFNKAVGENASKPIVAVEKLSSEWKKLGDNIKDKEKFLRDHADTFKELGVSVKSVADAENLLISQKDAFIQSQIAKAKAIAATEKAVKLAAEQYEVQAKLEKTPQKITKIEYVAGQNIKVEYTNSEYTKLDKKNKELGEKLTKLYTDAANYEIEGAKILKGAGIKASEDIVEGTKAFWEAKQKTAKEMLDSMSESEAGSAKWNKQVEEYNKATEKLKTFDISGQGKTADKKQDASEKLKKMSYDIQSDIDAATVASMQEGAAQQEAALKAKYDKQIALIEKKKLEITELEKITGKPATEQRTLVNDWATAETAKYETNLATLRKVAGEELSKLWTDVESRFRTSLENQLNDIEDYYSERKKELKDNIADESKLKQAYNKLDEKREKEKYLAHKQHELEMLDFETSIQIRRQKLKDRNLLLETQKEENLLKVEKEAAEQRLKKLKEMEAAGADVAKEISQVTLEIEEMNAALKEMPVNKFKEALGGLQKITGSLSGLDGEVGEIFGAISSEMGNMSVAFDSNSSTADKISAGVNSAVNMINMVTAASKNRKAAEKEFQMNQMAFARQYALALNEQLRLQSQMAESGFMTNYAGRIKDGFIALTEATAGYQDALSKLSQTKIKVDQKNAVDWGNVGVGAASGAGAGAAIGSVVPVIGTAIGAVVGAIVGGLVGLFGGKKKKDQYASLMAVFPNLVDGAGNLNKELAQTLINTNQVDDKTKQLLASALEWTKAIEEARAQIKEIVVKLSGDLGNSMKDAIVSAWEAGEDASKRMFDAASDSLEKFVEDLLYSTVFSDLFDQFADRLAGSLDPENGDQDIVDDYDWFMTEAQKRDDAYVAWLDSVKKRSQEKGFELWNGDETEGRQATAKGIAQASQDSIDELNGRMTAIQGFVYNIRDYSQQGINLEKEQAARSLMIQNQLAAIVDNTAYCRYLEGMSRTLDDINLKGVKIKP